MLPNMEKCGSPVFFLCLSASFPLYYSHLKKEIRLRYMKKQNLKRAVRYPVLHFEQEAAPVYIKVLAEQFSARGFLSRSRVLF